LTHEKEEINQKDSRNYHQHHEEYDKRVRRKKLSFFSFPGYGWRLGLIDPKIFISVFNV